MRAIEKDAGHPVADPQQAVETVSQRLRFTNAQQHDILGHFIRGGGVTVGGIMQAVADPAATRSREASTTCYITRCHRRVEGLRRHPGPVEDCARWVGEPTQYGVGPGSQLSVLVVLDHGRKTAPPGVIDNYIGWLRPRLHGQPAPRHPSLVGVLIVNTNLPVPSTWSRRRIDVEADREPTG